MKLHHLPSIFMVKDIQNFSHYEGDSIGISGSVGFSNPNATTKTDAIKSINTPPNTTTTSGTKITSAKSIGYGSDSDSQTSTTYAGINTSNITITGNGETLNQVQGDDSRHSVLDTESKTITMDNLSVIHTDITTDTIKENSGSLANRFDAEAVQNELDVQTRVTQEFNTIAPAIIADYAINQAERLRSEGNEDEASKWDEGGAYRIALQSVVGGLSGGISGVAGAGLTATAIPTIGEAINNSESIPEELKPLLIEAAGATIGAIAGEIVGGDATAGAISGFSNVENNYLTHWEKEQQAIAKNKCNQGDKEACKEFLEWNRLDREQSFALMFTDDIVQGIVGGANGLHTIMTMDPKSVNGGLVGQGLFEGLTLKVGSGNGAAIGYELPVKELFYSLKFYSYMNFLTYDNIYTAGSGQMYTIRPLPTSNPNWVVQDAVFGGTK